MSSFHFKEGMEVAHIGNLKLKLYVKRPLEKLVDQSTGKITDPKNGFDKEKKTRMDGILCEWWMNNDLKREPFHSAKLVPWEIALLGQQVAEEWLFENNPSFFSKMSISLEPAMSQAKKITDKYK